MTQPTPVTIRVPDEILDDLRKDEVLAHLTLYWATGRINSSFLIVLPSVNRMALDTVEGMPLVAHGSEAPANQRSAVQPASAPNDIADPLSRIKIR
jgi:hypothetical protein